MKAREIVQAYIEYYGINDYVDLTIYEKDLKVVAIRKGKTEYNLSNRSELIILKTALTLMEIGYELVD